jgi:putative addiction module component (TIGR02574 family)
MNRESRRPEEEDFSVPEKILKVQELWNDIARSPQEVEVTPAQREEAERRLRQHELEGGACSSWEEVKRRIESELG